MEVVVSLLIMGLLLTSIMSIIRYSLAMTGDALTRSRRAQDIFNSYIINDGIYSGTSVDLTFTGWIVTDPEENPPKKEKLLTAEHPVKLAEIDDEIVTSIIAFKPD